LIEGVVERSERRDILDYLPPKKSALKYVIAKF